MTKEEIEAAQRLIDTPITAENVDEPLVAFFPTAESRPSELGSYEEANLPRDAAGTRPEDSSTGAEVTDAQSWLIHQGMRLDRGLWLYSNGETMSAESLPSILAHYATSCLSNREENIKDVQIVASGLLKWFELKWPEIDHSGIYDRYIAKKDAEKLRELLKRLT